MRGTQIRPRGQREHGAVCLAAGDGAFLTFSAQLQIAFGRTPNHDPFALESSFTLSSTYLRRFRYRGIEAYV